MILRQYKVLGLDINTSCIRWVQISHTHHQTASVKRYGIIVLNENQPNISNTLKSLVLKHSFANNTIGVALPDSSIQKTTLTLDANLSIIQLKKTFKETAASLFNQPISEIYYQYQVLGFAKHRHSQIDFLLVAVQKVVIKELLKLLKASSLTPNVVDVESFAVERGQEVLNNRHILLEKDLDSNDFIKQSEHLTLSVGLAMHPSLKNWWKFL